MTKSAHDGKKPKAKAASAMPDEFNEPITVPFRGMFKDSTKESIPPPKDSIGNELTMEDLIHDSGSRRIEKLLRLADHYGIDRSGPAGWGLHLALLIAMEHHPGFEVVYDDWKARIFHRLYGFTPLYELKGKSPKRIFDKELGWASASKHFQPEFLAMLISRNRISKKTDEQICEELVIAADEEMKLRTNHLEKRRRTATLVRRLTEGRKRLKNNNL